MCLIPFFSNPLSYIKFFVLQGKKGEQGIVRQGFQGPPGFTGAPGEKGERGDAGIKGINYH